MCTQCHSLSEIELSGLKIPDHPHLKALRRKRKEMLRKQLEEEGKKVSELREENEILLELLRDEDGAFDTYD